MRIVKTIKQLRSVVSHYRKQGKTIGFVPTMGALHEGHLSLLHASKKENDISILSIFVNPTQFGPREDFNKYPRPLKKDEKLAKKEKVDIIFYPSVEEMYPKGFLTTINVEKITKNLCGAFRPGHFRGVSTVVGKLINIVLPDAMYLGQKDAQQAVVIKKFVDDLNFPVRIRICNTVREHDGLAMSSRNQYLNTPQRKEAIVLYQALREAKQKILSGERRAGHIINMISQKITANSSGKIQYIECVNTETLNPVQNIQNKTLIVLAVWFGKTRLIDNIVVTP